MGLMSTPNESLHAQSLEAEMQWLSAVMDARFKQHFEQEQDEPIPLPPEPLLGSALGTVCGEQGWGPCERLVLGLALAPHLRPELLDAFFVRNQNLDRGFTEFGGSKGVAHGGFIPTGETASFLLAGSSLEKRFALMQILGPSHSFYQNEILALESSPAGEPALSGRLTLSSEWLSRLCMGEGAKPGFTSEFPAQRVTTPLAWEALVLGEHTLNQVSQLRLWLQRSVELMHMPGCPPHREQGLRVSLHGPAGVGKTLSALLLGKQSAADVYKLDLKLIGGWDADCAQRGLDRIFKLASNRQWMLLIENAGLLQDDGVTATQASNFAHLRMHLASFAGLALLESRQPFADESGLVDMAVRFGLPDVGQRLQLWKIYLPEAKTDADVRFEDVAERYPFTGAQIANAVFRAFLYCVQRGGFTVSDSDLQRSLSDLE